MDAGKHAGKLNARVECRHIILVLDAASISASKGFQVPAIIDTQALLKDYYSKVLYKESQLPVEQ